MYTEFTIRDYKGKPEDFLSWRIWEKPKPTHIYAIGADVAEGIGGDASVAQVIDCHTGIVVANFWSNRIDVDNFAAELYKGGYYYNKARIIVEVNNDGSAVVSNLTGVVGGLRYPYLYKRIDYDQYTQKRTKIIGFKTTKATKPRLISNLKAALRDGLLRIYDNLTIHELGTFLRDFKTGKLGAKGSAKDDRVMSLALAWEQCRILQSSNTLNMDGYAPIGIEREYDPETGFPI